jgi:hypothetical protein
VQDFGQKGAVQALGHQLVGILSEVVRIEGVLAEGERVVAAAAEDALTVDAPFEAVLVVEAATVLIGLVMVVVVVVDIPEDGVTAAAAVVIAVYLAGFEFDAPVADSGAGEL